VDQEKEIIEQEQEERMWDEFLAWCREQENQPHE
jgi:hypothetical protein